MIKPLTRRQQLRQSKTHAKYKEMGQARYNECSVSFAPLDFYAGAVYALHDVIERASEWLVEQANEGKIDIHKQEEFLHNFRKKMEE